MPALASPTRSRSCAVLLLSFTFALAAAAEPIAIDGVFDDWSGVPVAHTDPSGDAPPGAADLGALALSHDHDALYLRIDMGRETIMQDHEIELGGNLIVYLDTDNDPATGLGVQGLGADLELRLGQKRLLRHEGGTDEDRLNALGVVSAPTHSSEVFEIRIPFTPAPHDLAAERIIPTGPLRLALIEANAGDTLPDGGSVGYTITAVDPAAPAPIDFDRDETTDLRVLCHNVWRGNIRNTPDPFRRMLLAARPDIISYQEIYPSDWSVQQAVAFVESVLPAEGFQWHGARVNDNVTVSRWPILAEAEVGANLVCRIDLPDTVSAVDLVLFNAHTPCCDDNDGRDREHDQMAATWRDLINGAGPFDIEPTDAVMIMGDLNMVGYVRQLHSVRDGDIHDNATWGPDFAPARSAGSLAAVLPRHTHTRNIYTWRSDTSSFTPGKLDYVLYSPDTLVLRKGFTIWTPDMTPAALGAAGLRADDSPTASDHLAMVADFALPRPTRAGLHRDGP